MPEIPADNNIGMLYEMSTKPSELSPVQYAPYLYEPKKKDLVKTKGLAF